MPKPMPVPAPKPVPMPMPKPMPVPKPIPVPVPKPVSAPGVPKTPATSVTVSGKTVALTVDRAIGLEPVDQGGSQVSHAGAEVRVRQVSTGSGQVDKNNASWIVRPGLASASGVSFESVDRPGSYLTVGTNGPRILRLAPNDGSTRLAGYATFLAVKGATSGSTSFQVWADRALYLLRTGTQLAAGAPNGSPIGRAASLFAVRTAFSAAPPVALTAGRSIGLESVAHPGFLVQHGTASTAVAKLGPGSPAAARARSSWIVRTGLGSPSGVSFEAVDRPGYFLVAPTRGSGALTVARRTRTAAFKARATFTHVPGIAGSGTSFRLTARPTFSITTAGLRLTVAPLVRTKNGRAATTFIVHSALAPAPAR